MRLRPLQVRSLGPAAPLALALATLASVYAGVAGCREGEAPAENGVPAAQASWGYVGDEACASCHADLYESYHRTGMGRSVSYFDPATAPERFGPGGRSPVVCHEKTGYCYQAFVRGDSLFQREFRPDDPAYERVYAASHVVGSGNATRSYLMTVRGPDDPPGSGFVTEMPLTWYVERELWDLSPGYEQTNPRFERPISAECMGCHNGPTAPAAGTQHFYPDVPLGITCERCHGPASAHVEQHLEGAGGDGKGGDRTIVNPARLSADLQLAVCQQCHLAGTTVFRPGESAASFRPGQALTAHRAVFVTEERLNDPEGFGISSHAERLLRSACFEQTRGTVRPLTCTTCHDPHRPVAEIEPDHFNAACRSCHGSSAHQAVCERPAATTRAAALTGDCVSCHLRRSGTSDIPHVTSTDHWIRRAIPSAPARPVTAARFFRDRPFRLVDVTARERTAARGSAGRRSDAEAALTRALATFHFYDTEHRLPAYLPDVARTIRRALAAGAEHPDARLTLGRALLEMDSLAGAERALAEAARRAPRNALAHYWLGAAQLRRGDATGALGPLAEAVRLQPRLAEARVKQAEALSAAGRTAEAAAALEQAVRREPIRLPGAWNDLGLAHLQLSRLPEARRALGRAVALDPRLVVARANLGAVHLASNDLAAAAEQFEAALRLDPAYAPALGNLGVVRLRQGRRAEARGLFERLLALNPADRQAAAYLAQLR